MLRDLLDMLRCPASHEESWLVAVLHRAEQGTIVHADLACPVCGAEFVVRDGTADLRLAGAERPAAAVTPQSRSTGRPVDPMRLAALLGVTDVHLPIVLAGEQARAGSAVAAIVAASQIHVNPPADLAHSERGASRFLIDGALPFGVHTVAGIALDATHAAEHWTHSAMRVLTLGGHLVAPAFTLVPPTMHELARDEHDWVAKTTARASGLIELRRRAPPE